MSAPSELPTWATNGGTRLAPSAGVRADGWIQGKRPPARWTNWLIGLLCDWVDHLDDTTRGLRVSNWSEQASAGAFGDDFNAVCFEQSIAFGSGLFVAVGEGGEIQTSPDGVRWTARTAGSGFADRFLGITFGLGLFVAVGEDGGDGEIQTSPDGITWTARSTGGLTGDLNAVAASGSMLVAVGKDGEIQTSPDGTTWTARTPAGAYSGDFLAVVYGNSQFVAVGETGEIQTSPDGITWTSLGAGLGATVIAQISYGAGFYLLATASGNVSTSEDLLTWTPRSSGRASAYGETGFIAVASGGYIASSNREGEDWRTRPPIGSETLHSVCYGNGRWVAVGANAQIVASLAV